LNAKADRHDFALAIVAELAKCSALLTAISACWRMASMNEPKQGESGATDKGKMAGSGQPGEPHGAARAETENHITRLPPLELIVPTSAKAMATALM